MIIDPKGSIAGHPSLSIRSLLRAGRSGPWDASLIQYVLGLDKNQSDGLIVTLEGLEYIAREKDISLPLWRNTIKGNALAAASAAKAITRKTADKKVQELLGRVTEVNESEYFLFNVRKVCIFGSYLENKERIGDIDTAVELTPKEGNIDKHHELEDKRRSEIVKRRGYPFSNFSEELAFPTAEVMRFLKKRSTALSLHPMWELEKLGAKYKTIFEMNKSA